MIKIYGSKICSTCVECKDQLTAANVPFEFLEITENIRNLRAFLKFRDTLPMYDAIREEGRVGIPLVECEDGTYTFDWEQFLPVQK